MKVTFFCGIGFAGAKREETFDFPDETTNDELQEEFEMWSSNFIDGGFCREEAE